MFFIRKFGNLRDSTRKGSKGGSICVAPFAFCIVTSGFCRLEIFYLKFELILHVHWHQA